MAFLHIMRYIKECLKKVFRNFSMTSVGESAELMKCGFFLALNKNALNKKIYLFQILPLVVVVVLWLWLRADARMR